MDTLKYEDSILKMLGDDKFYREVAEDLNPEYQKKVESYVKKMHLFGVVDDKEADYLVQEDPRAPDFYGLPKIHKSFEDMPPFRPIVGGCGSPCERISNLVDYHLQPLAKRNASFIKDTTDFCKKIKEVKCEEGDILVSADVSALYTVIDHSDGIAACEKMLDGRCQVEKQNMPTACIKQLIEIILTSTCSTRTPSDDLQSYQHLA